MKTTKIDPAALGRYAETFAARRRGAAVEIRDPAAEGAAAAALDDLARARKPRRGK